MRKKRKITRRKFIGKALIAAGAFTIVPRKVLGGGRIIRRPVTNSPRP